MARNRTANAAQAKASGSSILPVSAMESTAEWSAIGPENRGV
jgi:hypothetical protein